MLQIARIACTTMAVPAGLFLINEEGGMEKAEEFTAPPEREMGAPANWSHRWGCGCQHLHVGRPATLLWHARPKSGPCGRPHVGYHCTSCALAMQQHQIVPEAECGWVLWLFVQSSCHSRSAKGGGRYLRLAVSVGWAKHSGQVLAANWCLLVLHVLICTWLRCLLQVPTLEAAGPL